jgi:uncharacterized protein YjbJ (UPF0337 family)
LRRGIHPCKSAVCQGN